MYWTNLALPNSFSIHAAYGQPKLHFLGGMAIFWLLSLFFRTFTFELAAPQTLSDYEMAETM
jgi:hypothetical protein